jgi:hypothetical protein
MYLYSLYLRLLMLVIGAMLLWFRSRVYKDDDPLRFSVAIGNRIMYFGGIGLIALAFLLSLVIENPNAWLNSAVRTEQ